uniref:Ionotropic receptor 75q n=1 Tax=Colaphellus bowringi TaxID=561076 RepID=A0A0S3J2S5_9CUCU|nr:ionotropic receptor 75q [Colaphellus bowringi]
MLNSLTLFMILFLNFSSAMKNYTEIINIVDELLTKQNIPSEVTAYLCWSKVLKANLFKRLSASNILTKIIATDDIVDLFPSEYQIYLVDLDCEGSNEILKKAQRKKLFSRPFRWVFCGNIEQPLFNDLYFGVDSRIFFIDNAGSEYHIKMPYKREKNSKKFTVNDLAEWNSLQGFTRFDEFAAARNRTDLFGMNINISCVYTDSDTLNHLEDYRNIHIDPLTKLSWILVHHLMSILNASATVIFRNTWGYRDSNTSLFSGMIGDLQTGEAELGGTASFFTIDRIDVVEFYASSAPTYMKFIFRAPPLSYVTNVFTLPFHTYVWYCSFLLLVLIFFAIYVIVKWEWKDVVFREKLERMHDGSISPLRPTFFSVLLMEIGAITQQGTDSEPKSNAGRIATIFTFIALMFMYTSYSANIVALLQSTTESIRTLEDLLNYRISLGVQDIVYAHHYFEVRIQLSIDSYPNQTPGLKWLNTQDLGKLWR